MRIQGMKWMEQFYKRALLPYLEVEIRKKATKIKQINLHFKQLGSEGRTRNRKENTFRTSKMISEQQLDKSDAKSDVSITSVGSEKHDESFLAIEDEVQSNNFIPKCKTIKNCSALLYSLILLYVFISSFYPCLCRLCNFILSLDTISPYIFPVIFL